MTIQARTSPVRAPALPTAGVAPGQSAIAPRPTISAAEVERRREALRQAHASNRIEGVFRSRESDPLFEAFVRGDIELDDVLIGIKALHEHRR